jgi:AbrB family looped-hinge helix DNA binding protein
MPSRSVAATRLTSKGQVVIPKAVRTELGWKTGSVLEVVVSPGREAVTLRRGERGTANAWLIEMAGIVKTGDPLSELEAEHREEVMRDARRRT